jgi:tetratricopeptide (TPR) repeat protein
MILRLSDSLSRGFVVATALLLGLWLSFFGIRSAIARHYSEQDNAEQLSKAVRLEPGNPSYWYTLGRNQQYNLEFPDAAQAEESYKKAIALNPADTDAWMDLGTSYELDGKTEEARAAYQQAKKTYPTSADVSWRYGNFLLREGDQAQAYTELRRAIEADPHRAAAAFSRAYRSNPDIEMLLKELLPAKQSVYTDVIWEALADKQLAVAKEVWAQLQTLHPRLEIRDVDKFSSELLAAGEFAEAKRVWEQGMSTANLPALMRPQGTVVWDPSFETDMKGTTFAWRYKPIDQGVSIGLDKLEKLSGKQSLRLAFDGKHDPNLEAACTLAIVQPGTTYRFSGWLKTNAITSDQGIGFRLRGYDDAGQAVITNTKQVLGTNPWGFVDQTWTSGPKTHRVDICVVRDASENPEVRISGTAWVDDVNLLPQPAEHHKP